ncbi:MAG TPA: ATP-binding protein [Bryobacteraceae bacterium]|nr:ATP-binding protein [Bryobacteraceae bacterium]
MENLRLEFKSKVPDKPETLKKLSSFANSFGGFMVVGAMANGSDGRLEDLPGVDEEPGYKQKLIQWCFDALSPPLLVEVSDPIPASPGGSKVCYVVYAPESDVAPHFLNGRKGIWVRTDEFSQRYEPQLATETEISHLLDRRQLIQRRRNDLVRRARNRFDTLLRSRTRNEGDVVFGQQGAPRLEVSIGPRFPARPLCEQSALVEAFKKCEIGWRQGNFPRYSSTYISQHESTLSLTPGETEMIVEATVWGMLFYGTTLSTKRDLGPASISGVHLYSLVGYLLVVLRHANKLFSGWPYQGPLSLEVSVRCIRGVPWIYSDGGVPVEGPVSELDDDFCFSVPSTTDDLRQRPDITVINLLRRILFGMNWALPASDPAILDGLLKAGRNYNFW